MNFVGLCARQPHVPSLHQGGGRGGQLAVMCNTVQHRVHWKISYECIHSHVCGCSAQGALNECIHSHACGCSAQSALKDIIMSASTAMYVVVHPQPCSTVHIHKSVHCGPQCHIIYRDILSGTLASGKWFHDFSARAVPSVPRCEWSACWCQH